LQSARSYALLVLSASMFAAALWVFWKDPLAAGRGRNEAPRRGADNSTTTIDPDQGGDLFFPEPNIDVGVIKETVQRSVRFENRGSEPVRITHIQPDCSCTTTKPDTELLKPGEAGLLTVTVNPRTERVGTQVFMVDVEYAGARSARTRLTLRAEYRPDLVVPDLFKIRSVVGRTTVADLFVVDYRDVPLEIESVTSSTAGLAGKVTEKPSQYLPGWRYRLEVTFASSKLTTGLHQETLFLHTSDPDRKTIPVRVTIDRAARVRVAPSVLRLKPDPTDPRFQVGKVFLDDTEGEAVEIAAVSPSAKCLHCKPLPGSSGERVVIEATAKTDELPGSDVPLTLRIVLKKPDGEELCIPVAPHFASRSGSQP
jgi:hypothetical protein